MSRGMGKVQRMCLSVLAQEPESLDSITIAARGLQKDEITESEHVSFRRALRKLERARAVVDLGRGFRDGRRRWALPHAAARFFDDEERGFGRHIAAKARAKANFTVERFPEHA